MTLWLANRSKGGMKLPHIRKQSILKYALRRILGMHVSILLGVTHPLRPAILYQYPNIGLCQGHP